MNTREVGVAKVFQKIVELGGTDLAKEKEGNKSSITFTALNGKKYRVFTRSKNTGSWQTTINYGEIAQEKPNETEFWVFVDISLVEAKFYIAPFWWVKNDIYTTHNEYLEKHHGHRPNNNDSTHHSISQKRIEQWEGAWGLMGLNV